MTTATPDLEAQIAERRRLAEAAMRQARRQSNPRERRRLENKARGHLQVAFGLESKRTDPRVCT